MIATSPLHRAVAGAVTALALLLDAAAGSGEVRAQARGPADDPPVIVEDVRLERERVEIRAVGESRAVRSVTLHPAAAGEVTEVRFRPGQQVDQGEVLLRLDSRDQRLAVELGQLNVDDAELLLSRYRRTEGTGAVPPTTIDSARTALATARIELARAEVALEDRTLRAPFAGVVGLTDVDVGDRIDTDTEVTTLDDRSRLLVRFEVPEQFLGRIDIGRPLSVATWAEPERPVEAVVEALDSRVDPATRTFTVRAEVSNPSDRLRPGMSFRAALDLEGREYPVVPEIALQWGGDGAYVWAVRDGRARRVPATVVSRREGRVMVDADLEAGVAVVSEGVQRLREDIEVTMVDPRTLDGEDPVVAQRDRDESQ